MKENNIHNILLVATAGTITTICFYRILIYNFIHWHPLQGQSRYIYLKNMFKSEGGYQGIITIRFRDLLFSFFTEKKLIYASLESIEILCHLVKEIKEYPIQGIKWCCLMSRMIDDWNHAQLDKNSHLWKLASCMLKWDSKYIFDMNNADREEEIPYYQRLYNFCYNDCLTLWRNGHSLRLKFSLECLTHLYFYRLLLIPNKQIPFPEEKIQELKILYPINDDSQDDLYFRMNYFIAL